MRKIVSLIILLLLCLQVFGQLPYNARVYKASVIGDMKEWKKVVDEMSASEAIDKAQLTDLLNYQYGYVAWSISAKQTKQTLDYLEKAEQNRVLYRRRYGEDALCISYECAFTAFQIAMNPVKGPVLGPKCVRLVHKAVALNSNCVQAWIEYGNVYNYMPTFMGGSKLKALKAYQTALNLMKLNRMHENEKWLYPFVHASIGKMLVETGQYQQAQLIYESILKYEPNYIWVKNKLSPELKELLRKQKGITN